MAGPTSSLRRSPMRRFPSVSQPRHRGCLPTSPIRAGSALLTLPLSGWSAGAYDFDNDGRKDLFAACGDVQDNTELFSSRKSKQPNLLLFDRGEGKYSAAGDRRPGAAPRRGLRRFRRRWPSGRRTHGARRARRASCATLPARANHWIGLRLTGSKSNRDAIGAEVHIVDGLRRAVEPRHDGSRVRQQQRKAVHFGLGNDSASRRSKSPGPPALISECRTSRADRYLTVREP